MSFVDPNDVDKDEEKDMSEQPQNCGEQYPLIKVLERIADALEIIAGKKILQKVPPPAVDETKVTPVKPTVAKPVKQEDIIENTKAKFSPELSGLLNFTIQGNKVRIAPKRFLGSENFSKIAAVVRDIGGEYKSAGRDSHFLVPQ